MTSRLRDLDEGFQSQLPRRVLENLLNDVVKLVGKEQPHAGQDDHRLNAVVSAIRYELIGDGLNELGRSVNDGNGAFFAFRFEELRNF